MNDGAALAWIEQAKIPASCDGAHCTRDRLETAPSRPFELCPHRLMI